MAAGHLTMAVENDVVFFTALALLIVGNGFFKPNISATVGSLYPASEKKKKDGGFTIFYIGINLGAAMSPLLCGYVGETYGWHYGFGLATIGMLTGLAVFVAPTRIAQLLIGVGALGAAVSLLIYRPDNPWATGVNVFVAVALALSAIVSMVALQRGGLPADAGAPPDPGFLHARSFLGLSNGNTVYVGALASVPIFGLLVSGFSPFTTDGKAIQMIGQGTIDKLAGSSSGLVQVLAVFVEEISKPAGMILTLSGLIAAAYLIREALKLDKVPRERMIAAFVMIFFSILFWSFFEQAGSSMNNFADRNIDRVSVDRTIDASDVGTTIRIQPTQEQLGFRNGDDLFTLDDLTDLREQYEDPEFEIDWVVSADNVGMGIAVRDDEIPASVYQSVNAVCILIFGLILTGLWGYLAARRLEPSTPFKFALGLLQLALGFGAMWYGAQQADARGMVGMQWLVLGYLLHTTGELCLSPVGLSMITKLSPRRLVSTMMGAWFLATAFAQYVAAIISQFTGVGEGDGDQAGVPIPAETVNVYGDVFYQIFLVGIGSAAVCFLLAPLLKKWQHEDQPDEA